MKKYPLFILLIFVFTFAGCGGGGGTTTYKPSASTKVLSEEQLNSIKENIPIQKKNYIEHRKCNVSELNIRNGPGVEFELNDTSPLYKSENMYVLEEKNGWIRFRATPNDVGWEGWASKKHTCSIDEWNKNASETYSADIKKVIQKCKNLGLLIKIDTDGNRAWVNMYIWNNLDYDAKKNYASIFAEYCEVMGDSSWCDILDSKSGKKLAKHSSWGFKVY